MEIPKYRCHKEVRALKIQEIMVSEFSEDEKLVFDDHEPIKVSEHYVGKHNPRKGGYYVVYEDGYESFSPADAFESGYILIE